MHECSAPIFLLDPRGERVSFKGNNTNLSFLQEKSSFLLQITSQAGEGTYCLPLPMVCLGKETGDVLPVCKPPD